jgi:uncharacterized protein (TIGR02265 family)
MVDKLIFSQTFEGIFRALGPRLDANLSSRLKEAGVDPSRPLRPAYPVPVFHAVLQALGDALYPALEEDERHEELARMFMSGYSETMVGRAMLAMMRVIGPRRTLERLSRQFRTGNNFSETALTELGNTEFELWCNQVTAPGWYVGLIERGLELAGAHHPKARLVRRDEAGATFRVTWDVSKDP